VKSVFVAVNVAKVSERGVLSAVSGSTSTGFVPSVALLLARRLLPLEQT
jgi:hypothetical protein